MELSTRAKTGSRAEWPLRYEMWYREPPPPVRAIARACVRVFPAESERRTLSIVAALVYFSVRSKADDAGESNWQK